MSNIFPKISADEQINALAIDAILFNHYGGPFNFFSIKDPLNQMVSALLSHRTKNAVSGKACRQLRAVFPTWEAVIDAPVAEVLGPSRQLLFPKSKPQEFKKRLPWFGN